MATNIEIVTKKEAMYSVPSLRLLFFGPLFLTFAPISEYQVCRLCRTGRCSIRRGITCDVEDIISNLFCD